MKSQRKEKFYQSISLLLDIKGMQKILLIDGRFLLLFAEIRHLFVSQWKKTLATRVIFLVTALTSLAFVSWRVLKQPARRCTLWGYWKVSWFTSYCWSLLIHTLENTVIVTTLQVSLLLVEFQEYTFLKQWNP